MTTTLSTQSSPIAPTGCCPVFDPATWDEKEFGWKDHPFVVERVRSLFHVPLNMGRKIVRAHRKIAAAHAEPRQGMMLVDETSPWGATLYIDTLDEVPGAEMASLSGTYLTKVFDGPFRNVGAWSEEMKAYVAGRGRKLEKLYYSYTTCPSCAKAYGHNYVVLFAKVADEPPAFTPGVC
jgi:hypothetical protein